MNKSYKSIKHIEYKKNATNAIGSKMQNSESIGNEYRKWREKDHPTTNRIPAYIYLAPSPAMLAHLKGAGRAKVVGPPALSKPPDGLRQNLVLPARPIH